MAFADIKAKTAFHGYAVAADQDAILAVMATAYNGSATAKAMFDSWIATAGHTIDFTFGAGQLSGQLSAGIMHVDVNAVKNALYIDNNGNAVPDTLATAVIHELGHALTGKRDNFNIATPDYKGDNVVFVNKIYAELGLPQQNSYISYDATGTIMTLNYAYTNGAAIDASVLVSGFDYSAGGNFNSGNASNTNDLLIGDSGDNILDTGGGNDFLFGGGGNDTMRGGAGTDTAVYLDSNPADYDIRNQADGSWIVRDVRGAKTEGNDTLQNIEKLQFDKTQLFDLTRGGLTFESDLVFVIDTTGSMGSYIDGVKAQIKTIIAALFANGKTDARIAIESFKDTTNGEPSKTILKFTDQDSFADRQTAAINAINSLSTGGGGDIPETDNDGLIHALNGDVGLWRSGAASKRIILFTDAPVKDTELEAQVAALTASPASDGPAAAGGRAPIANAMGATGLQSAQLNDVAAQGRSNDPSNHDPDASPPPAFVDKVDPITGSKGSTPSTLFAIQVGTDSTATDSLKTLATTTGGSYLDAPTPADLVKSILAVVALPPPPPPPPVAANFSVTNTTTGVTTIAPGAAYSGPVAGLAFQYIYTGPDNTNVTGQVPNCFIHTGSGFDAIDVSKVGGTNVLDGGTNSNFLVGGKDASGSDTFFVDDRSPPSDIWSTVGNFHAGDSATVFGITQSGFATDFVDGEGAVGYTGVTLHVTAPGIPTASLTLAGYSVADLSNGRLTTSFGMEGDGTPYFFIHANS